MISLSDSDILDLFKGTQKELGRGKFTDAASRLTQYEVFTSLMKNGEMQTGKSIQKNIMVDHAHNARWVGLHQTDNVDIPDVLQQIDVPWRHITWYWAWERREPLMQAGADKMIVDVIKLRRIAGMISAAEQFEAKFWASPTSSSDTLVPWGVKFWVVLGSSSTGGFNGGLPSGFTDVAGLDPTTYTRWKNWNCTYAAVTDGDLVDKMRQAYRAVNWKPPVDIDDYKKGSGRAKRVFMNEETIRGYEALARQNNDNLGADLDKYGDETTFRKSPVRYIPSLDSDAQDPVFMLNFDYFGPIFLKGDYMRETDPKFLPEQHNSLVVHVDCTLNNVCTNRRAQAVINKAA